MEDAFFSQLDGNAVRELLLRTELRHAALFAVSDTLRICGATVPPMTAACGSFRTKARVIWVL